MTELPSHPLEPGARAPDFALPAINRDGTVSLADFRGRRAVLVGLFRGLHCPFCRRQIAELGVAQPALAAAGVETIAVINTPVERARLYYRHRPTAAILLSDPDCATHRAFGVPQLGIVEPGRSEPGKWPARVRPEEMMAMRIDPTGEIGEGVDPLQANARLNSRDGFEPNQVDQAIYAAHGMQLAGHFLVDRDGMVRWMRSEAAAAAELCSFPSVHDLIAAARALGSP
jgi:peroxiredoxin